MALEDKVVALVCVGAAAAVLRQVTEHLELEGYEVVSSGCASEARALLQSDPTPAVIVLPLPRILARRELAHSVLTDRRFEHAPLISIAGPEQIDELMRYREVAAWFDAPVDLPGLTQTLEWLQPTEALCRVAA